MKKFKQWSLLLFCIIFSYGFGIQRLILVENGISLKLTVPDSNFYNFKNNEKSIARINKLLITDTASFRFGVQPNKNYSIIGTTAFYDQFTDALHYILLTHEGRNFHFEIPLRNLSKISISPSGMNGVEVVTQTDYSVNVKEYSARGGVVYDKTESSILIPLPESVSCDRLIKILMKIQKKAIKYSKT